MVVLRPSGVSDFIIPDQPGLFQDKAWQEVPSCFQHLQTDSASCGSARLRNSLSSQKTRGLGMASKRVRPISQTLGRSARYCSRNIWDCPPGQLLIRSNILKCGWKSSKIFFYFGGLIQLSTCVPLCEKLPQSLHTNQNNTCVMANRPIVVDSEMQLAMALKISSQGDRVSSELLFSWVFF